MNTEKTNTTDDGHICDLCGKWDSKLIKGACSDCIKKYNIRNDDAKFRQDREKDGRPIN